MKSGKRTALIYIAAILAVIILYTAIGKDISDSTMDLSYTFHRRITSEPLFWVSMIGFLVWLIARIICVADSFDAMNSSRVYRNKLTKEKIISEIETNKGLQFDPEIADIMLRLIRTGKIPVGE